MRTLWLEETAPICLCHSLPLSLPLCICLYLCLSASLSLHLCVSLGVSVSVPHTLPTHRVLGIQQCPSPCLWVSITKWAWLPRTLQSGRACEPWGQGPRALNRAPGQKERWGRPQLPWSQPQTHRRFPPPCCWFLSLSWTPRMEADAQTFTSSFRKDTLPCVWPWAPLTSVVPGADLSPRILC